MKKHIVRDISRDINVIIDVNYAGHIIGINYHMGAQCEIPHSVLKADVSLTNWVVGRLPVRTFSGERWIIEKVIDSIIDFESHYCDPAQCAGFEEEYSIKITEIEL